MKSSLLLAFPLLLASTLSCSSSSEAPSETQSPETGGDSSEKPTTPNEPPEGCTPGSAGCTCVDDLCLGEIECIDNICFGPEQYLNVPPSEERLADIADEQAGSDAVLAQFRECGLLGEGDFFFDLDVLSEDETCVAECFNTVATCDTAREFLCDMPSFSRFEELEDCVGHCGEFTCSDGEVIPEGYLCDGTSDCSDGEDELLQYCGDSENRKYLCDGQLRSLNSRCNGIDECEDGYDELNCGDEVFDCGDGTKLPRERVCDLYENCPNGADESEEAGCAPRFCD